MTQLTYVGGEGVVLTAALQQLIERVGMADLVQLHGAKSPDIVVQYMQQAHALVNPIVIGMGIY